MRAWILGIGSVLVGAAVLAGPTTDGGVKRFQSSKAVKVQGGQPGLEKLGPYEFKGGEKACVIAKGYKKEQANRLGLQVYDDKDRLVAEDLGTSDYAAAIWYPARTAKYTILLINPTPVDNEVYVVIK